MTGERRHEATTEASATLLDARGLTCPLPVLKARKRLMGLAPGERLLVLATDPKAPEDFRAFCAEAGHALLESGEEAGAFRFLIGRR
jgi:tRNA 2-thiouridine synthesizing protein A